MKTKDITMLEQAYLKILKEEGDINMDTPTWDMNMNTPTWDMNMGAEKFKSERINSDKDREEEGDEFKEIKIGLGRENASPKQADLLQGLDYNQAKELLKHLNSIGEDNEDNWVLKDNLILQLFDLLKNPNI
jgi:hypothetical protein